MVERDKYGRYVLPDSNGELRSWTRATTFGSYLSDKHHLRLWNDRMLVKGLTASPELLAQAAAIKPGGDYQKLAERGREFAGARTASELGTSVHDALDAHLKSGDSEVADGPHRADIQAICKAMQTTGVVPMQGMTERIVVRPDLATTASVAGVAGTFDLLAMVEDMPTMCDLKTGKNPLLFGALEISAQLATYASAEWTWNGAAMEPMPKVRQGWGLIIHCRPGSGVAEIFQVGLSVGRTHVEASLRLYDQSVERNRRQRTIQDVRDRAMIVGLLADPTLVTQAAALSLEDKTELNAVVWAAIDKGAEVGNIFISPEPVTIDFEIAEQTTLNIRQAQARKSWAPYRPAV